MNEPITSLDLGFDLKDRDYIIWQGKIVMSRSEEPYFQKLFSRLAKDMRPARVLEIGFGLGISAGLIQLHLRPAVHQIIEIDAGIFNDLVNFACHRPSVVPCLGDWRRVSLLTPYDFVFYDPFDYFNEHDNDLNLESALLHNLVGTSGVLCHPHFGDGTPRQLPHFRNVVVEQFEVSAIDMADGSSCDCAALVLCYPIS